MAFNSDDNPSSGNTQATTYTLYPNQLRKYASSTYNLKLQVTKPDNYNAMIARNPQTYDPSEWTTIAQTGGLGPIKASRPAVNGENAGTKTYFNRDLYIDNLEMQTVLGISQETRGTNAIQISFTITEPNGMDFIEELYDFCHDEEGLNEYNYVELPYLLVISFKGYDDTGALINSDLTTKYVPIHIYNAEVKLTASGAEYQISAAPYNESFFTVQYGYLSKNETITGKTLTECVAAFANDITADQQDWVKKGAQQYPDTYKFEILQQSSVDTNLKLVDIGSSIIGSPDDIATKDKPFKSPPSPDGKTIDVETLAQNFLSYQFLNGVQADTSVISADKSTIQFASGSSIFDCLNNLIICSKYVTDQVDSFKQKLTDLEKQAGGLSKDALAQKVTELNQPFQWYKIICDQVEFGKYDKIRNVYAKTFHVKIKPYIMDDSRSPSAPSALPEKRVLKQYDYIMTGKNTEVIDFNIQFQLAFLNYRQVNPDTKGLGSGAQTPEQDKTQSSAQGPAVTRPTTIMGDTKAVVPASESNKRPYGTGLSTIGRVVASDVVSTLYSKGDLLILDLTIMGDPDYIKQDEIFRRSLGTLEPYATGGAGEPGGILFDAGSIYFLMNFLTPVDYNLNTGLMDVNQDRGSTAFKRNMFSGLYEIITVDNSFKDGKFTQRIQARRFDDSQVYVTQE